eukprot:TRINITY_DN60042_c0_g1_i1.p1 TRINITY_DN60042_c0_g1~~TRINITY_DN60042_c0_g1_i1.p1  ORF type:complete len:417 (+),score=187.95 TRINITY_DN60042_c0_g1_i1:99-1349(+)
MTIEDNFGKVSIDAVPMKGKKVLMRVDFNVPVREGRVKNDLRIRGAMNSIKKVLASGGSLILMSHLGRPKQQGYEASFSLRPVAARLSELLEQDVMFAEDCLNAGHVAASLQPGQVLLLENLRFYKNEASKKEHERLEMAQILASYGDVFVSDAFGTAHRNAASMTGIPYVLGSGACGYLIKKEIDYFSTALRSPKRPLCAIVGGAKVSDKILLLDNLITMCDKLLIGGAMAYTFLKAQGRSVGNSKCEVKSKDSQGRKIDIVALALQLIEKAEKQGVELVLPVDHRCAPEFKDVPATCTVDADIPPGLMALDIGPKTEAMFASAIGASNTAIWNGPVGVFEMKAFRKGTYRIARALAEKEGLLSIVCGGDTAAAAEKAGYAPKISHISTGGGAALELLEGKVLPGLKALSSEARL